MTRAGILCLAPLAVLVCISMPCERTGVMATQTVFATDSTATVIVTSLDIKETVGTDLSTTTVAEEATKLPNNATTMVPSNRTTIMLTEATTESMPASTSMSSASSPSSPSSVTMDRTEATTLPTSTMGTTTDTTTEYVTVTSTKVTTETLPTEPPPATPRPGPVPEPSFPEIERNPVKTYRFAVSVVEESADGCLSSDLDSPECIDFAASFPETLIELYGKTKPAGFQNVTEVTLRAGSIIVEHDAVYMYNDMDDEGKSLTAQQMYDATVGMAVTVGYLNGYDLQECESCNPPIVTSDICSFDVQCAEFAEAVCPNNYWICESVCYHDDAYDCSGHGVCRQEFLSEEPICSCNWDSSAKEWYWGYNCQYFADQTFLIIGCSCGGAVFFIFLITLIVYLSCCKKSRDQTDKTSDRTLAIDGFQNLSFAHQEMFPAIDDLDEGDIVSRTRPYSYLHVNPDDPPSNAIQRVHSQLGKKENNVPKPQESSPQRLSNSSNQSQSQTIENTNVNETASELRPQDFWGNTEPITVGEHIQLNPVLDHIDTNERFKLQRPRISMNGINDTSQPSSSRPMSMQYSSYANHVTTDPRYHDMHTRAPSNRYSIPEPDYSYQR